MTSEDSQFDVNIGARQVGVESPTMVIAEVAQAHDGSLGTAHAFVDAIADAGADAVKFQTHIAHAESTPAEPFRVPFSLQDASRYEYWERTSFTEQQWIGLAEHASQRRLFFLSSPFSVEAVELLERVGVPAWKVGSGEVANEELLTRIAVTGLPILLSSGMSALDELDRAVGLIRTSDSPVIVLQCTSEYPSPPERTGLNMLSVFRERYRCPVGLSDHSGTIYPSLAAVALGAAVVEVHVALSREMFGPDVQASITTRELRQLCDGARFLDRALAQPVDKDALAQELEPVRELFRRSIAFRTDLPAGTILEGAHLALKKPGTGLPAERMSTLVGRRLNRPVRSDELVRESDLE